jgi:hypothetical protein
MTEINSEVTDINKNVLKLSDVDIRNLMLYLNHLIIKPINKQENLSIDFYLSKIFTKNPQLSIEKGWVTPMFFDNHQTFSLELATCGMQKNTPLPVSHAHFSLTNECFGDDAGFTMQSANKHFLGSFYMTRFKKFVLFSIGISDGAGGNLMYGYDPRLFSQSLMRNCSDLAHTGSYSTSDPKRLLCHAFDRVQTENCFGILYSLLYTYF